MKQIFRTVCSLLLIAALCAGILPVFAAGSTVITLYHTNDVHGRVDQTVAGPYDTPIGIASIAAARANTENSLLVDGGDALHGTPAAVLTNGEAIVRLMNAAGYDFMTIGNHEFNYGWEQLQALRGLAEFPVSSSNIIKDGTAPLDASVVYTVGGVRIGLFGLTTEYTAESTMPSNVVGVTFADPVAAARTKIAALQAQGAQIIIAVCHLGDIRQGSAVTSEELAKAVPELDVIVDGHSHSVYEQGRAVGDTLIVSAGQYENYLGRVELTVDGEGHIVEKNACLLTAEDLAAMTLTDKAAKVKSEVEALVKNTVSELSATLDQVVAHSGVSLSSERAPGVRTQQTEIGYLVAESYRIATGADISFANGGDIRADLAEGDVSYRQLISILPFFNFLQTKLITPKQLKEALENGLSALVTKADGSVDASASAAGKFPQVAGFSFTYDPTKPVGSRVLSITLDNGTALSFSDDSTQLRLGASEYVLSGGDGYDMLAALPVSQEFGFTADKALADYLTANEVTPVFLTDSGAGTRSQIKAAPAPAEPKPEPAPEPAAPEFVTYLVRPGDCLWAISHSFYGTGNRWGDIFNANLGLLFDPRWIYPGQLLRIPD